MAPCYSLKIQAQIPATLCALHNFIWIHSVPPSGSSDKDEEEEEMGDKDRAFFNYNNEIEIGFDDNDGAKEWQDGIVGQLPASSSGAGW